MILVLNLSINIMSDDQYNWNYPYDCWLYKCRLHELYKFQGGSSSSYHNQGPVVQNVVSLTISLRVISLTVLADSIHNILIFFAEKMWVAFALSFLQGKSPPVQVKEPYGNSKRLVVKKVREKSRECHNHKPQPIPDPKRKRKPTNLNKHKPNKCTKSTKISSLFPKRGNRNTKRTKKHKNKMTHRKTYHKSPRRINHKATKSKTNTGTTALERSVEQTTGGFKALLQLANFTLGPNATLNTEIHKNLVRILW